MTEEKEEVVKNTAVAERGKADVSKPFTSKENFSDLYNISKMFSESDLVPDTYKKKPMNCVIAVDLANRMGVSPLMVMQNLYIVRGKPEWSGSACMSLIQGCGLYKEVKPVYTGEKNTDSWGCHIEAKNAKTGEAVKGSEVTIKMAKAEGWYDKSGSKWKSMPELMLSYRAAAFFARVYCPNAMMGFSVEGEAEDIQRESYQAKDIYAKES